MYSSEFSRDGVTTDLAGILHQQTPLLNAYTQYRSLQDVSLVLCTNMLHLPLKNSRDVVGYIGIKNCGGGDLNVWGNARWRSTPACHSLTRSSATTSVEMKLPHVCHWRFGDRMTVYRGSSSLQTLEVWSRAFVEDSHSSGVHAFISSIHREILKLEE